MDPGLREFGELVRTPEPALDLAWGALLIARVEHGGLDASRELARLDKLAGRSGAGGLGEPRARLARLRAFLFEEEGFRGDAENYYDPRNSCLNDVLDRKLGIPITLSVLMMEVGRRLGLAIAGVGLPGHFVVRAEVGGEGLLLDPFNAGAPLSVSAAEEVAARAVGRPVRLGADSFAAVTKVQILTRMLMNLEAVYVRGEAWQKALAVVDRLRIVEPGAGRHRRDRGAVLVKLGRLGAAAEEWERYLGRYPNAEDVVGLRQQLRAVRQKLASLN